jgi:HEAT repeat protein
VDSEEDSIMAHNLHLSVFGACSAGLALSILALIGCGAQSGPNRSQLEQQQAQIRANEKQGNAEVEASQKQWAAVQQRQWESPGNISVAESDALIEALRSPSRLARWSAAEKLADAKGQRATPALIEALHHETEVGPFVAMVEALDGLNDGRAGETLVWALNAPSIPDTAREHALLALDAKHSIWNTIPAVKLFYATATDESVRQRAATILQQFESSSAQASRPGGDAK